MIAAGVDAFLRVPVCSEAVPGTTVTGFAQAHYRLMSKAARFCDHPMVKPADMATLLALLERRES
jgi:hypothetical protein